MGAAGGFAGGVLTEVSNCTDSLLRRASGKTRLEEEFSEAYPQACADPKRGYEPFCQRRLGYFEHG